MPGYDDRKVRPTNGFARSREGGAYYRQNWQAAIDSQPDWVVINSFNEWAEGTYIEPSQAHGSLYLDLTAEWSAQFKGADFSLESAPAPPPSPTPLPKPPAPVLATDTPTAAPTMPSPTASITPSPPPTSTPTWTSTPSRTPTATPSPAPATDTPAPTWTPSRTPIAVAQAADISARPPILAAGRSADLDGGATSAWLYVAVGAFVVALIPTTLADTTLGALRPGGRANVETDLIAKYVAKLLGKSAPGGVSLETLMREGFA